MGEITQAILEGLFCEVCGSVIDGNSPGYNRPCKDDTDCQEEFQKMYSLKNDEMEIYK